MTRENSGERWNSRTCQSLDPFARKKIERKSIEREPETFSGGVFNDDVMFMLKL